MAGENRLVVYGATGFTGGLVCDELARREVPFVAGARNPVKLASLADRIAETYGRDISTRVAEIDDPKSLDALMEGAGAVLNVAGPFTDVGLPVVEAAVRNEVHYLDTTGEQSFMLDVRDRFGDAAEASGIALMPATAFEYATGDCASAMAAAEDVRQLVVAYATTGFETSRGTKKSILRSITAPGYALESGALERRKPAAKRYRIPLPDGTTKSGAWFAGGEPLTVPRHHPRVESVSNCLVVGRSFAAILGAMSPVVSRVTSALEPALDAVVEMTARDPHAKREEIDQFTVIALDAEEEMPVVVVEGEEPYAITARIIVEAATRLTDGEPEVVGFTSAGAQFDPREFLECVGARVTRP